MQLSFNIIQHGTNAYRQMCRLRIDVLLQPIDIDPSFIKPEAEKNDILIGAYKSGKLIGCCILTPKTEKTTQVRQMAVRTDLQRTGIGAALLLYAEAVARANHFESIRLHARSAVVLFYQKSGYVVTGAPFEEVGIQHFTMEKRL